MNEVVHIAKQLLPLFLNPHLWGRAPTQWGESQGLPLSFLLPILPLPQLSSPHTRAWGSAPWMSSVLLLSVLRLLAVWGFLCDGSQPGSVGQAGKCAQLCGPAEGLQG